MELSAETETEGFDLMPLPKPFKVSVCVVTYNQENFIRQCLQSIVDQERDFELEIIVGEDCSTDGTRAIVEEFVDRYPTVVKSIYHARNIGPTKNYFSAHGAATGDFIAHIDGDDYCLPGKLQKQKVFLEQHEECAMVFHSMLRIVENEQKLSGDVIEFAGDYLVVDVEYLVERANCSFAHSSKMYRSAAIRTKFSESIMLDFKLNIEQALYGKIGYLNEFLGCYRSGIGFSKNIDLKYLGYVNDAFVFAENVGIESEIIIKGRTRFLDQVLSNYLVSGLYPYQTWIHLTSHERLRSPLKLKIFSGFAWLIGQRAAFHLLRPIYLFWRYLRHKVYTFSGECRPGNERIG